jgi:uncharacterized protein
MTETTVSGRTPSVTGDPAAAAVALLTVVVLLLGMQFIGAIPATSISLFIPVLLLAGFTQVFLGLLAIRKGENVIGLFFCTFGPFSASFGLLVLGLQHGWWLIPPADIPHAEAAFLMGWTIVLTLWFFLSFVLPLIFTLLLTLVDVGLWSLLSGIWNTSEGPQKFAGYLPLATAAGGVYYMSALWPDWAGAVSLPLGRPIIARGKRNVTAIAKVPAN